MRSDKENNRKIIYLSLSILMLITVCEIIKLSDNFSHEIWYNESKCLEKIYKPLSSCWWIPKSRMAFVKKNKRQQVCLLRSFLHKVADTSNCCGSTKQTATISMGGTFNIAQSRMNCISAWLSVKLQLIAVYIYSNNLRNRVRNNYRLGRFRASKEKW